MQRKKQEQKAFRGNILSAFCLALSNFLAQFAPFFLGDDVSFSEIVVKVVKPDLAGKGLRGRFVDSLQRTASFEAIFPQFGKLIPHSVLQEQQGADFLFSAVASEDAILRGASYPTQQI